MQFGLGLMRLRNILLIFLVIAFIAGCAPKQDFQATYTAFWEALPSDTPMPSDTPSPSETPTLEATATLTPSPTDKMTETPTQTPTETVTPTLALTARLIWPRAKFGPEHVSWREGSCPTEGQRLSCEFEYRKDGQGGCYVGGTCYDDCGWFYSIDTIPPGVEEFSEPCW